MQRVNVVGVSGAGKTTFARSLAARLGVPHVELDALHHGPNWAEPPLDVFRERVSNALQGEGWVVDGNYSKARDITWGRADTVIWLNYHWSVTFWRLWWRSMRRLVTQETLWESGNRESWRLFFFSRQSLFLWALKTYSRNRRQFPTLFPQYPHLNVVTFETPRTAERWLQAQKQESVV